jgi:putative Mn2+ efflux pump MntP
MLIGAGVMVVGAGLGSVPDSMRSQLEAAGGILSILIGCTALTEVKRLVRAD